MTKPRFIVTELEGILSPTYRVPGLSCHVVDTLWAHKVMATFRTEDARGLRFARLALIRKRAHALADELNTKHDQHQAQAA